MANTVHVKAAAVANPRTGVDPGARQPGSNNRSPLYTSKAEAARKKASAKRIWHGGYSA